MSDPMQGGIGFALLRASIYHALVKALSYPGPVLLESLRENCIRLISWHGEWPEGVYEAMVALKECAGEADVSVLAEDYVRLFGPAARVPLTETSWGDMGRMLGKAAQLADISAFYHAFKARPLAGRETVPEDHLIMELEFMSILCLKEAHALNQGLERELQVTCDAQKKFLQDHLATWTGYWMEQLVDQAPALFYLRVGEALQTLIPAEIARLGVEPVPIRGRCQDREVGADSFTCPMAPGE
jgi:TorA maturation chaperone TorD